MKLVYVLCCNDWPRAVYLDETEAAQARDKEQKEADEDHRPGHPRRRWHTVTVPLEALVETKPEPAIAVCTACGRHYTPLLWLTLSYRGSSLCQPDDPLVLELRDCTCTVAGGATTLGAWYRREGGEYVTPAEADAIFEELDRGSP